MKPLTKALVGLTLLPLSTLPVHADSSAINPAIRSATTGFYLNLDRDRLNYREDAATGGTLDSDQGTLLGASLGWTWIRDDQAYIQVGASYHKGKVTYVGQTLGGTPVTGNQDTDRAGSIPAIRIGYMFATTKNMALTPYVRFGLAGLGRIIGVTPSTPDGQYNEAFVFYYVGLGLMDQYAFTDRLVGSVTLGYDADVYNRLDILYPGGECREPLGSKPVKTAGIALNYRLSKNVHAVTSLEVRRYGFGQSQPFSCGSSTLYEPTDHITETTARVGLQF